MTVGSAQGSSSGGRSSTPLRTARCQKNQLEDSLDKSGVSVMVWDGTALLQIFAVALSLGQPEQSGVPLEPALAAASKQGDKRLVMQTPPAPGSDTCGEAQGGR